MQYAVTKLGPKTEAAKGLAASCGICGAPVIAKCGRIKIHHWAHLAEKDCDPWSEPETEWHRAWKRYFPEDCVEVTVGEHRADIRKDGLVVELQNSSLSVEKIEARERFYGNMVWIVNAESFAERLFLLKVMDPSNGLVSFKWKHMRPRWRFAKKPVYLDLGPRSVESLFGGKRTIYSDYESYTSIQIVREKNPEDPDDESWYCEIDESLPALHPTTRRNTILRLNTVHENGYGSAFILSRPRLILASNGSPVLDFDPLAFD